MIEAKAFIEAAMSAGIRHYSGVPCSFLKPLINGVIDHPDTEYVGAANEGDAVAIASGFAIAGYPSVALMQNSGLGNAVSPLTSLNWVFGLPILLIVTWRGNPQHGDEPQHELMGAITTDMLEAMDIEWAMFPEDQQAIGPALEKAQQSMQSRHKPFAFFVRKGSISPQPLQSTQRPSRMGHRFASTDFRQKNPEARPSRQQVLATVQQLAGPRDVLIATTGYTGRELYALSDEPNQLYVVGSMGCASSLGLGLALADPGRRVFVLDGDGAALMRMGNMATIGQLGPANLVHVLIDNERHESTGGQSTVSAGVDFAHVATSCGYSAAVTGDNTDLIAPLLKLDLDGPRLAHIKVSPGAPDDLPRPTVKPPEVLARLRTFLENSQ
ncbi:MAG: thiamine pyrophosphate enzyme [Lysobacteraceae bacterium]|nr:MAG: thiamine pyrophosphate enzyme [Xanthomonadaceae bacterium]